MVLPLKWIPFAENYLYKYLFPLLKIIISVNIKAIKIKMFLRRENIPAKPAGLANYRLVCYHFRPTK